jgi:hypothetical protein
VHYGLIRVKAGAGTRRTEELSFPGARVVIQGHEGAAAQPHCGSSPRAARLTEENQSGFVTNTDRAPEQRTSAEAVETLVWLLKTPGVDRRRYRMVNRLRTVRDSEEFATLPEDLRERVRQIVAESES